MGGVHAFFILASLVGAAARAEAPLAPLAVGNRWIYRVSSTYPGCPSGDQAAEVRRRITIAGRTAFEFHGPCVGYGPSAQSVTGGKVDVHYAGTWYRWLDEPVVDGHQWLEFRAMATWKRLGTVTVEAGTFSDCWRKVRGVAYTDWSDYCRGAGLVRSRLVDLAGGYIDLELRRYSLK